MVEPDSSAEDSPPEESAPGSGPVSNSDTFEHQRRQSPKDPISGTDKHVDHEAFFVRPEKCLPDKLDSSSIPEGADLEGIERDACESLTSETLASTVEDSSDGFPPSAAEAATRDVASITEQIGPIVPATAPPGPGVIESAAWTAGVIIVHVVAAIGLAIVGAVYIAISGQGDLTPDGQPAWFTTFLLTSEMAIFVVVAIAATAVRLQGQPARYMGFSRPPVAHLLILVILVMPVSIISSKLYELVDVHIWSTLVSRSPLLQMLDGMNTMDTISQITGEMSLFALLMTLAVAPAIGEEIVFRGVIGRGLVARLGVFYGVLLTSVFFAAVHIHPVHAVGVFLLGVTMHMLHLASRSFWAPVLYHYLNNAWATVMSKYGGEQSETASIEEPSRWFPVTLAIVLVMLLLKILWDTRVKYIDQESGEEWSPGYESVETPPPWISYERVRSRADSRMVIIATVTTFLFFDAFFATPDTPEAPPETPTRENAPLEPDTEELEEPLNDDDSTQACRGGIPDSLQPNQPQANRYNVRECLTASLDTLDVIAKYFDEQWGSPATASITS